MWMQFGGVAMLALLMAAILIVVWKHTGWMGLFAVVVSLIVAFTFAGMIVTAVGMIQFQDFHTIWMQ